MIAVEISDAVVALFAASLGIDVDEERELLRFAKNALSKLPDGWELGIGEDDYAGYPFFHNVETNESRWTHPDEDLVREALVDKRRRVAEKRSKAKADSKAASGRPDKEKAAEVGRGRGSPGKGRKEERVQELELQDVFESASPASSLSGEDGRGTAALVRRQSSGEALIQRRPFSPAQRKDKRPEELPRQSEGENEFDVFRQGADRKAPQTRVIVPRRVVQAAEEADSRTDQRAREEEKEKDKPLRSSPSKERQRSRDWGSREEPVAESRLATGASTFELDAYKQRLLAVERELADERAVRRRVEESLGVEIAAFEKRLRSATDDHEERARDAAKRMRQTMEEELRAAVRAAEKKLAEELADVGEELLSEKRRSEELRADLESARRKLLRESGRGDAQEDLERAQRERGELEIEVSSLGRELRKAREELVCASGKLASVQQVSSVAQAEMETLRVTATAAQAEAGTCHAALVQATQRMQQVDGEVTALRAANYLLKQECETSASELRKLRLSVGSSDDRAQVVESEAKRRGVQLQQEVHRLSARVAELEAIVSIQRSQLESAAEQELGSVREVQRGLDAAEYEVQRLKHRLLESEGRRDADQARLVRLDSSVAEMAAALASKDVALREERRKVEQALATMAESASRAEEEAGMLRRQLDDERRKRATAAREHAQELRDVRQEASESVPRMVSTINASLEEEYADKLEQSLRKVRTQYEERLVGVRREQLETDAQQAEREAARRIAAADDRAELEALRSAVLLLRRTDRLDTPKENAHPNTSVNTSVEVNRTVAVVPAAADGVSAVALLEQQVMLALQDQLREMRAQLSASMRARPTSPSDSQFDRTSSSTRASVSRDASTQIFPQSSSGRSAYSGLATRRPRRHEEESLEELFNSPERSFAFTEASLYNSESARMSAQERSSASLGSQKRRVSFSLSNETGASELSEGGFHEGLWRMKYS